MFVPIPPDKNNHCVICGQKLFFGGEPGIYTVGDIFINWIWTYLKKGMLWIGPG